MSTATEVLGIANGTSRLVLNATTLALDSNALARQKIRTIHSISYNMILPAICVCGIIGNIFNLLTLRSPVLQAVSYMYVRALAIADLGCMIFTFLFIIRSSEYLPGTEYSIAFFAAHFELPLINSFIAAGVLTIIALTVDRYVSVVFPARFRQWNTARLACSIIITAYVFSTILYIPMIFKKNVQLVRQVKGAGKVVCKDANATFHPEDCTYDFVDTKKSSAAGFAAYKWARECLLRLIPIAVLTYLNIHIIVRIHYVRKRREAMLGSSIKKGPTESSQTPRAREQNRILVMLAGIVVLFFVCNIPAAINLVFIKDEYRHDVSYQMFRAIANLLEVANHAVNFYIFCMCSKDYRDEFLKRLPPIKTYRSVVARWVSQRQGIGANEPGRNRPSSYSQTQHLQLKPAQSANGSSLQSKNLLTVQLSTCAPSSNQDANQNYADAKEQGNENLTTPLLTSENLASCHVSNTTELLVLSDTADDHRLVTLSNSYPVTPTSNRVENSIQRAYTANGDIVSLKPKITELGDKLVNSAPRETDEMHKQILEHGLERVDNIAGGSGKSSNTSQIIFGNRALLQSEIQKHFEDTSRNEPTDEAHPKRSASLAQMAPLKYIFSKKRNSLEPQFGTTMLMEEEGPILGKTTGLGNYLSKVNPELCPVRTKNCIDKFCSEECDNSCLKEFRNMSTQLPSCDERIDQSNNVPLYLSLDGPETSIVDDPEEDYEKEIYV